MLLETENLTVQFDNDVIIDQLSFVVNEGEIVTILGPNGAGKTALLKTLLGLLPYKGKIIWHKKLKTGYLPQGLNQLLLKGLPLTVRDFFSLKRIPPKTDEIIEYLNMSGLNKDILTQKADTLSGGQFQRMLISWVLIANPKVIFLDEPTTGLDIGGGETVYSLLQRIRKQQNLTIFIVTHDISIVSGYSTNVLCLTQKRKHCFGPPKETLTPETLESMFGANIKLVEHHHG